MLQARLQPIPLMALLSMQQQPGASPLTAAAAAAVAGASPAGSPSGSASNLDPAAAAEQPLSPTSSWQRQQRQPRPRLIEEKRLVQLFKSRSAALGG